MRGITLRGLRKLVEKIKQLLEHSQFFEVTSTYPVVSFGGVRASYSELTTTDIVER